MKTKIEYALKTLNNVGQDNGFTAHLGTSDKVYLKFKTTETIIYISDEEIEDRAVEFLESEIEAIKRN
jgi:hypothetical protein